MENIQKVQNQILNLIERNLEIRSKIYTPVGDTIFDKVSKWFKKILNK